MSVLSEIKDQLEANENIEIVQTSNINHLPLKQNGWSQEIEFFIAPKNGVYFASYLETLLHSLITKLAPSQIVHFNQGEHVLTFGRLYFTEEVGIEEVHTEITLTDSQILDSPGFVDGKISLDVTEKLYRSICIRLFPNLKVAKNATKGRIKDLLQISNTDLKRSKSFIQRVMDNKY